MDRRTSCRALSAALAGLAALSGCTAEPDRGVETSGGARECFLASQVDGFHALDRDHVQVFMGASRVFELGLDGTCTDIDWSQRIAIRSRGSDWVCRGLDADLIVPSPIGTQRCLVTSVRRLSPEEARAARQSRRRD